VKKFTLFLFMAESCNAIHASSFMSDFVNTVKFSVSIVRDDLRDSFFPSPPPIQGPSLAPPVQRSSLDHLQKFGWIAEQPYVVAENNRNNDFSVNLAREMYGMSKEGCKRKRAAISEKMKQVFYDPDQAQEEGIPFNTHRMWITSRDKPSEAPVERLKIYLESLKKLNADGWAHHFWCMKKNEIPETMKILQSSEVPVIVHELEEIFPKMNTKFVFDAYYEDRQFCIASDVARQAVIYLYGGIYSLLIG
jgi:hypothetical protein